MLKNFFQKKTNEISVIEKITETSILATVFLAPLVAIPLSGNFITHSKTLLIFLVAILMCLLSIISVFKKKRWEIILSPFAVPLLLYSLANILSIFLTKPYPVQGLLGMGGYYLAGIIIAITGGSLMSAQKSKTFIRIFSLSAAILAVSSLLQLIGFGPSRIFNLLPGLEVPNNLLFNLSGSSFVAIQVLLLALLGIVIDIKNSGKKTIFNIAIVATLIVGIIINAWSLLPGQIAQISIPDIKSSVIVASKAFSTPKSAIIGYGTESYTNVFSKFKPTSINNKPYWQFNFGSAINYPLTVIVSMGLIGLLSWSLIAFQALKQIPKTKKEVLPIAWILAGTFILQILLPANLVIIAIQVTAIAFLVSILKSNYSVLQVKATKPNHWIIENQPYSSSIDKKSNKPDVFFIISIAVPAIILAIITFLIGRAYLAYFYQYKADMAIVKGDALNIYDYNKRAASLNPYLDTVRRQYALANLQIAIALSNNPQASEEDKNQVTPLVSQAIAEAKAATSINPNNAQNWLTLAEIYKNLVGSAEGADQWTLDSYVQAAQEDPINPITRVEIGHLFLNKGQYEEAISFYTQAIQLKPDLPMGYFHLGNALAETKKYDEAKSIWEQTLTLLEKDSEDYKVVMSMLNELETRKSAPEASVETPAETAVTDPNEQALEIAPESQPALVEPVTE